MEVHIIKWSIFQEFLKLYLMVKAKIIIIIVSSGIVLSVHGRIFLRHLKIRAETSLVVQWLSICLPMQGTWVRSLVRELRSHMLWGN